MAAQRGEDRLGLAGLLARQRLADGGGQGVGRLGRGHDPLGAGELQGGREALHLADGHRLGEAQLVDVGDERRHAVVAQPAGVDRLGDERRPQGVHLQQGRGAGRVAEVVAVLAPGERRAGGRLHAADCRRHVPGQLLPQERHGQAAEVRSAAGAPHEQVGGLPHHGQLAQGLLADDGLVQDHVVEHASQRVADRRVGGRHRDRLGDGDAQRAWMVGVVRQQAAAVVGDG